ncbi:MAG: hypothetical protein AAGG44_06245 [Planctomycetota bacterium]
MTNRLPTFAVRHCRDRLPHHRFQHERCGAILICVLVCMLVAGSLIATTTLAILRARREAKTYQMQVQAMQLLDAGVQRAVFGFAQSGTEYQGEKWTLDSTQIPIPQTNLAIVTITVEQGGERENSSGLTATSANIDVSIEESAPSAVSDSQRDDLPQLRPTTLLKRSIVIPLAAPAESTPQDG